MDWNPSRPSEKCSKHVILSEAKNLLLLVLKEIQRCFAALSMTGNTFQHRASLAGRSLGKAL